MHSSLSSRNLLITVVSFLVIGRISSLDPIEISKKLISFQTITPQDKGCVDYLKGVLESLGFSCHILEFGQGQDKVRNLYARYGTASPNLCYAGHVDVVTPGNVNKWTHPPFKPEVNNQNLYGRGVVDMKGSVAAYVAAVSRLDLQRAVNGSLSFIITGNEEAVDETNGILKTLEWLREKKERIDFCVIGEPTSEAEFGDMIKIGRRGILSFRIECRGRQGHVAYQELAKNPIDRMVKILHQITDLALDNGTEYFQPSNCEIVSVDVGNTAFNVIPGSIASRLNVRYNTLHTADSLIELFSGICHRQTDECALTDITKEGDPFITQITDNTALMIDAIKRMTGKQPRISTTGGTSDARFIKDLCDGNLVEFGLVSKTAHHVDENTPVNDIYQLTDIYREFINGYFQIN